MEDLVKKGSEQEEVKGANDRAEESTKVTSNDKQQATLLVIDENENHEKDY